jgi:hypothetical protein
MNVHFSLQIVYTHTHHRAWNGTWFSSYCTYMYTLRLLTASSSLKGKNGIIPFILYSLMQRIPDISVVPTKKGCIYD